MTHCSSSNYGAQSYCLVASGRDGGLSILSHSYGFVRHESEIKNVSWHWLYPLGGWSSLLCDASM